MTKTYKNIEFDVDQLAITITTLEKFMEEQNDHINFYFEKLNGAGTTQDVREWTESIRKGKKRIKSVRPLLEQMAFNEFTTKYTLLYKSAFSI